MTDPYSVLGVTRDSSMDEIKKAYRTLSRKYHPDANINNPNKDLAEEKFKEVQEAYEIIVDEKEHGTSSRSYGTDYGSAGGGTGYRQSSTGGYTYGYSNAGAGARSSAGDGPKIVAAINFCNSGHFAEAITVLDSVPYDEKNAKWYYVHGFANLKLGNHVNARDDLIIAVRMEPDNLEYRRLLDIIESGGTWYTGNAARYGNAGTDMGSCCTRLLCLNLLCNTCCIGGRCI